MDSLTKRPISEDELGAVVRHCFGPDAEVADWSELTGGTYSATYRIQRGGPDLVLKVAPPPHLKLLQHEVQLLRTEVDFYARAGAAGVPVPQVWCADLDRRILESDYLFMQRFTGSLLTTVDGRPTRRELGAIVAQLHRVTGYPLRGSRTWQSTWRKAFLAMVGDILDDARRLGSELPAPPDEIAALVARHAGLLDEVRRPALVHYDLWDGNIFVRPDADGWRVEGLIDGERAFFGDPLAEFVSLALLRDIEDEPELLAGYAEQAGTPLVLDASARRRISLYTVYLYLIMVTEGATRGYDRPRHEEMRRHVLGLLDAQLSALAGIDRDPSPRPQRKPPRTAPRQRMDRREA